MLAMLQPSPAKADEEFMLLTNRFGELCTMCEAIVLCEPGKQELDFDGALPQDMPPRFTLYHFQTKDFWGQIATIWDYFARWVNPVVAETRPVIVYEVAAGVRETQGTEIAGLSVKQAQITVGSRIIDRNKRHWLGADGEMLGACARLPLRDALLAYKAKGSWGEISRADQDREM